MQEELPVGTKFEEIIWDMDKILWWETSFFVKFLNQYWIMTSAQKIRFPILLGSNLTEDRSEFPGAC